MLDTWYFSIFSEKANYMDDFDAGNGCISLRVLTIAKDYDNFRTT